MICRNMTGIRNKKILHIKISPKVLHRVDFLKLCFRFYTSHVYRHSIRNLRNICKRDQHFAAMGGLRKQIYCSSVTSCKSLTDVPSLYPHSNLRHRCYDLLCSFNGTILGVGDTHREWLNDPFQVRTGS